MSDGKSKMLDAKFCSPIIIKSMQKELRKSRKGQHELTEVQNIFSQLKDLNRLELFFRKGDD